MILHATCPQCGSERTYDVITEGPDWDVGAGPTLQGGLVGEESCPCVLTPEELDREWDIIAEKADEPYEPDFF